MVEAMYHQSPEFFKSYQKQFRFFISDEIPNLHSLKAQNFAFGKHESNQFCPIKDQNHYHVLIDTEGVPDLLKNINVKTYVVPCLLSTFKFLIYQSTDHFSCGVIMEKLALAAGSTFGISMDSIGNLRKRLPYICFSQKKSTASQTDGIPSSTLTRFMTLFHGPQSGEFCRIVDVLLSGYGNVCLDNNRVYIRFEYERKAEHEI